MTAFDEGVRAGMEKTAVSRDLIRRVVKAQPVDTVADRARLAGFAQRMAAKANRSGKGNVMARKYRTARNAAADKVSMRDLLVNVGAKQMPPPVAMPSWNTTYRGKRLLSDSAEVVNSPGYAEEVKSYVRGRS